jgi:peptidoglycan/LPS O-acetylase OafA/YrhL
MVYLQDIMGLQPINIVFWTLCFEVQFYIIFGALLYVRSKFVSANQAPAVTSAIFGMLLIMSLSWPLRLVPTGAPGLFISLWYLFLLGVLTRWASSNDRTAQVCLTLAFVVLTLSSVQLHNATAVIGVGTAVALWAAVAAGRTQLWLSWKWLQGLGLISYSLYLIHDIVGIYVRDTGLHLTRKHLDLASVGVNYFWCGMAICASIVAARLLHIYIEAPSQRLSKRLDLTALGSLVQRQLRGLARFR